MSTVTSDNREEFNAKIDERTLRRGSECYNEVGKQWRHVIIATVKAEDINYLRLFISLYWVRLVVM